MQHPLAALVDRSGLEDLSAVEREATLDEIADTPRHVLGGQHEVRIA